MVPINGLKKFAHLVNPKRHAHDHVLWTLNDG
jgi:hypothetical protein